MTDIHSDETKEPNDTHRPAIGPENREFHQKVLTLSAHEKLSKEEVVEQRKNWQKLRLPEQDESSSMVKFPLYFYAGFWIRLVAFLVDLLCIATISSIFLGSLANLTALSRSSSYLSVYGLLSLGIYLGYFILLTKLNHGQTIGKMIFGIRVVSLTSTELSWQTVLVREGACRFILKYPLLLLGYLPAAFSRKKQHLGDYLSDTSVITINLMRAFDQELE